MICAIPDSEETGTMMPENCVAGRTVKIVVPNSAAICVRVKAEISIPYAVVVVT